MTNHELLNQVNLLLDRFGIDHCFARSKGSIITSGEAPLKKFLQEIGFSNMRHIKRISRYYPNLVNLNRVTRRERLWVVESRRRALIP
jgi:hypothetical protein